MECRNIILLNAGVGVHFNMTSVITITQTSLDILQATLTLAPNNVESLLKLMMGSGVFDGAIKTSLEDWKAAFTKSYPTVPTAETEALSASSDLCYLFVKVILEAFKTHKNDEAALTQLDAIQDRFMTLLRLYLPPQYDTDDFIKKYIDSLSQNIDQYIARSDEVTQLFTATVTSMFAAANTLNEEMVRTFEGWKKQLLASNDKLKFLTAEMHQKLNTLSAEIGQSQKDQLTFGNQSKDSLDTLKGQITASADTFRKAQDVLNK